jgi:hypothetical protein
MADGELLRNVVLIGWALCLEKGVTGIVQEAVNVYILNSMNCLPFRAKEQQTHGGAVRIQLIAAWCITYLPFLVTLLLLARNCKMMLAGSTPIYRLWQAHDISNALARSSHVILRAVWTHKRTIQQPSHPSGSLTQILVSFIVHNRIRTIGTEIDLAPAIWRGLWIHQVCNQAETILNISPARLEEFEHITDSTAL